MGHHWSGHDNVCPRLLDAMEIRDEYAHKIHQARQPNWVLDYEFTSYGRYRTQSGRVPWRARMPHTVHLYPPGVAFWEDTRGEGGYRHSAWICFAGGEAAGLNDLVHPRLGYGRFLDPHHQFGTLLREIVRIGQGERDAGFWRVQAVFANMLNLLLRSIHDEAETYRLPEADAVDNVSDFVRSVDRYLRTHIGDHITLDTIARQVHVSVSTLSHRYRRETGRTPIEHLIELRIGQAKMLLVRGMGLKTIAARLGFADAFHLSKTFKRVEGLSPRSFLNVRR